VRLFAAAWPPEGVVASLAALERPARPGVRWTGVSQWHVTLRFFGELDVDAGVEAGRRVAEAATRAAPAVAELGPEVSTFGHNVLQVPVHGLDALAKVVVEATSGIGQPPSSRPFSGHITLARNRKKASLDGLVGEAVSARWAVEDIALVASVASGQPGVANRYDVVATFPLTG